MKNRMIKYRKFFLLPIVLSALLAGGVSCGKAAVKKVPKAKLSLSSVPAGAVVTIAGKRLPKPAPLNLSLPEGTYIVKFQLPGHIPQWKKVQTKIGKTSALSVTLQPLTTNMLVSAKADGAFGVQVTYNGKLLGETPLVIRDIPMGKGEITLSKRGYSSRLVTFEAKDATPLPPADQELSSNMGTLSVNSNPSGARVFLNDKPLGTTPLEEKMEEGSYTLTFRKDGYEELQKNVLVKRLAATRMPEVTLQMKKSSLSVTTSPAGAKVYLDGTPFGNTPCTFNSLTPGAHTIRVEKEGFDADERKFILSPGVREKFHFTLDTNMGGLDLVTTPAGLTVYVDGKSYGKTKQDPDNPNYSEVLQIRNLTMGKHTIRISHKRAQRPRGGVLTKEVTVRKGKIERVENLSLWIPDTRLYLKNGRIVEGRLHFQNDTRVNFEAYPGLKADRLKEDIRKIEKIPLEE